MVRTRQLLKMIIILQNWVCSRVGFFIFILTAKIVGSTLFRLRKHFSNGDLPLSLRTRMLRCYIFFTLLYEMQVWTMKKAEIKNIQAFEMWCFRIIFNISWADKITNVEILRKIGKEPGVMNNIKSRKLQYFGRMLRGEKYQCLHLIMQGKMCGKKNYCRGRLRTSWLQNLRDWFLYKTKELFNVAKENTI